MKKTASAALATLALAGGLTFAGAGVANAHNHVANPSGVCNNSQMGTSPGNSGEGAQNPGNGRTIGKANAGPDNDNCKGRTR